MKNILIRIGFWNNGVEYEDYIWPQELVGEKHPNSAEICSYLSRGVKAAAWMGYSYCRICGKTLGSHCLTDGFYIWPEKLEHYVSEHNVRLPEEFIEHACKKHWEITIQDNIDLRHFRPKENYIFWKEWCRKNSDSEKAVGPGPEYPIPEETGEGKIEINLLDAIFGVVERVDVVVDVISVRSVKKDLSDLSLKKVLDKFIENGENSYHLWTAKIEKNKPLIRVYSDRYAACAVLKFDKDTPVFYCGNKESMYANVGVQKRYCPDLLKKYYIEIEK